MHLGVKVYCECSVLTEPSLGVSADKGERGGEKGREGERAPASCRACHKIVMGRQDPGIGRMLFGRK